MKVLITGSEGFVGRHFVQRLEDNDLTLIDINSSESRDVRDFFMYDNTRYDLVIHLAAIVGGRATIEGAPLAVAGDLAIDSDAIQWALRTRPHHFVYYSSSAAYPIRLQQKYDNHTHFGKVEINKRKLTESDIDLDLIESPDLTYGWAKLTGEMLARYAANEGLRMHVFRPFSGYGSDQSLDYPFPSFITRALQKQNPFEIWGYGTQVRDWIHIDDIVEATLKAVEEDIQGPVNLCSGIPTSFNDLFELVTAIRGYKAIPRHHTDAPVGVHYRVGDPTKLNTFYTPRISLEQGIIKAINDMQ